MKKILIMILLLCSFASAVEIYYGDGNCDLEIDTEDMNIMLGLLNNQTMNCCFNETFNCANMDINMNGTFDSNDLILLSNGLFGLNTLPKYGNLSVVELLNFHSNLTVINNTIYIQNYSNYTFNSTNLTQQYCIDNYNTSITYNYTATTCPAVVPCVPTKETIEVEKVVIEEKEVWWNWKVGLLILFISILGLLIGYTYAINYGG